MGTHSQDGYSADVEGYLVIGGSRVRLGKSNDSTFVLAEPCELPAGTVVEMLVLIDGNSHSRLVSLPDGVGPGQMRVSYVVAAPF